MPLDMDIKCEFISFNRLALVKERNNSRRGASHLPKSITKMEHWRGMAA